MWRVEPSRLEDYITGLYVVAESLDSAELPIDEPAGRVNDYDDGQTESGATRPAGPAGDIDQDRVAALWAQARAGHSWVEVVDFLVRLRAAGVPAAALAAAAGVNEERLRALGRAIMAGVCDVIGWYRRWHVTSLIGWWVEVTPTAPEANRWAARERPARVQDRVAGGATQRVVAAAEGIHQVTVGRDVHGR